MELVKITDLTENLGISSRTLRYYEQKGLISSVRPQFEKYRFYDAETVERLRQIVMLRKMQISVKDILRIYESEELSTIVEVFAEKISELDHKITALSELKSIVNDFLASMEKNGVTKISALPLLYEELGKQVEVMEDPMERLARVSEKLRSAVNMDIVDLPEMKMLSSLRDGVSDVSGFMRFLAANNIRRGLSGRRESFEYQNESGETVFLQKVGRGVANESPYQAVKFKGGLFAVCSLYADDSLAENYRIILKELAANPYYDLDYAGSRLRHETLVESVLSPDEKQEKVNLYIAVKKRVALPSDLPKGTADEHVGLSEIEAANTPLWTKDILPGGLSPEADWSYHVNGDNEGEYIPVIDSHCLFTGVKLMLPFRVDVEFKVDMSTAEYGYNACEGDFGFHHGSNKYGVNVDNYPTRQEEAISFEQPIYGDGYFFPKLGAIDYEGVNRLTWVLGEKYFAVIINGEVRFCSKNMPYMAADWSLQEPQSIILTANGSSKRLIRSVRLTQLEKATQGRLKAGALTADFQRSNNVIGNIHRLITSDHGENYWFNGCAAYVMECLGESDYNYNFFAGLTGDVFTQVYGYGRFLGDGVTDYMCSTGDRTRFIRDIFRQCGYTCEIQLKKALEKDRKVSLRKVMSSIDRGVPVIEFGYGVDGPPWGVFVGYENFGETLLLITGNKSEPRRVSAEEALKEDNVLWAFTGEKFAQKDLSALYREAVARLPALLTAKTENWCFGAEAFRAWAADIEKGFYEPLRTEDFDQWTCYTVYVCNLSTNACCAHGFIHQALKVNPDMKFLNSVYKSYHRMQKMWNDENGQDLEALGGGFNISLEALQDRERRGRIADKLREFAACVDGVQRILESNI